LFVVYFFKGVFYDIPSINQQINYTKNTLMHEKDLFEKVKNAKPLKVMGLSEVAKELKRKEFMFDVIPITRGIICISLLIMYKSNFSPVLTGFLF